MSDEMDELKKAKAYDTRMFAFVECPHCEKDIKIIYHFAQLSVKFNEEKNRNHFWNDGVRCDECGNLFDLCIN